MEIFKVVCGIMALGFIVYIPIWRNWRWNFGCKMLEKIEKSLQILLEIAPETQELTDLKSISE